MARPRIRWSTTWKPTARRCARMRALTGGQRTVPVLVEDGKVVQIGWQGRGCVIQARQEK